MSHAYFHQLLSGEIVAVDPIDPPLRAYIDRLATAAASPTVSVAQFADLLYASENPLLDPTIMPGRGTVTMATFRNPAYVVMLDLLGRKRLTEANIDPNTVRERYSLTVKDAAAKVGVHESAIRQAIAAGRLASVKVKAQHLLDPAAVELYKPSTVGAKPPVEVVVGSAPGVRLAIAHDGTLEVAEKTGNITTGRLEGWSFAVVIVNDVDGSARAWEIAPGGEDVQVIGGGPFSVRGRFTIVEKTNNALRARAKYSAAQGRTRRAREARLGKAANEAVRKLLK